MNGIHDMGGMQDFGPVVPQRDEPVFHAPWEGRMYAMWMAVPGDWSIGADRVVKELIPPADYLRMSYYDRIRVGLEELMVKTGLVTRAELDTGRSGGPAAMPAPMLTAAGVAPMIAKGFPSGRDVAVAARFAGGARVRARNMHPVGHTRLPRYARGRTGTVARDRGVFVFADSDAEGRGEQPQHVYSVCFPARELWGAAANLLDKVYIDLWEDHLEPA